VFAESGRPELKATIHIKKWSLCGSGLWFRGEKEAIC